MQRIKRHTKRISIGIVGGLVVMLGIIAIPYPGPGWLIVLAGFAILATEFEWARRTLDNLRIRYDGWVDWLKRQRWSTRLAFLAMTSLIVIVTIWLFNGYGILDNWFHLGWDWVHSPLLK